MRQLITTVLFAFSMSLLGPTGLEATAMASTASAAPPGVRTVSGKKKRKRNRPPKPRNDVSKVKLKKAKDKERGFEL